MTSVLKGNLGAQGGLVFRASGCLGLRAAGCLGGLGLRVEGLMVQGL